MNKSKTEWIRQAIINLTLRAFCGGLVIGWVMIRFYEDNYLIYLIIGSAAIVYYAWTSWMLYNEIGKRISRDF